MTRKKQTKTKRTTGRDAIPSRKQHQVPAPVSSQELRREEMPVDPKQIELVARFKEGKSLLALLPAVALRDVYQDMYTGETMALRQQLIRDHGDDAANVMLADAAASSFFVSRWGSQTLSRLLGEGSDKATLERAEYVDKLIDRAHRRLLASLEALGRGRGSPVRMQIGDGAEIGNLNLGSQLVGAPTAGK